VHHFFAPLDGLTSAAFAVADCSAGSVGSPALILRIDGRPVGIAPMARRQVLAHCGVLTVGGRAHMRGNPLAAMEDVDRARRDASPNLLAQHWCGTE
jgi:hypothetical protein